MEKRIPITEDCYLYLYNKPELVRGDKRISLSVTEYKILSCFAENKNRPVSLDMLVRVLWGLNLDEHDKMSIKPHISHIRKKLAEVGYGDAIDTNYGLETYCMKLGDGEAPKADAAEDVGTVEVEGCGEVLRTATFADLIDLGYTSDGIAQRLIENDDELFTLDESEKCSPEMLKTFLESYPESFQYLVNKDGQIVGNFSFVSLISKEQAEDYVNGRMNEKDLDLGLLRDLNSAGDGHILLLLNLSIRKKYNTICNNVLLRLLFLKSLLMYAESDIYFKGIIAKAFSPSIAAFFRAWRFENVRENVYALSLGNPDFYMQLKRNKRYRDIAQMLEQYYLN